MGCAVLFVVWCSATRNSLVTQVKVFGNQLGQAGGEALAQALESNTTVEEVSVGNVIKGITVRLKSNGEMCTLTMLPDSDNEVKVIKADGSQSSDMKFNLFDPIPAVLPIKQLRDNAIAELDFKNSSLGVDGGIMLAAVLKRNASVTKVSVILRSYPLTTSSQRAPCFCCFAATLSTLRAGGHVGRFRVVPCMCIGCMQRCDVTLRACEAVSVGIGSGRDCLPN